MRTLLLAFAATAALALPAVTTPAAACGPQVEAIEPETVHHTASGHIVMTTLHRNDAGRYELFVSYPMMDGAVFGLYGIFAELADDRATRAFARLARSKAGSRVTAVQLERTGDTAAWHLVSYTVAAP